MSKNNGKKDKGPDPNNPLDMVMAQREQILDLVATRQKLEASLAAEADLKEVIKQLKEQLGTQKFEQDEIFAYLNKQLVHKSRTVAVLERAGTRAAGAVPPVGLRQPPGGREGNGTRNDRKACAGGRQVREGTCRS